MVELSTEFNGVENVEERIENDINEIATIPTSSILIKSHPLKDRWTLWFLNNKKDMDWLQRLKEVATLTTVEQFWSLYDNIRPPSVLNGCDYNLFKEGIQPMWEVVENKNGGRLIVVVEKTRPDLLDAYWLELLISLIGNQFGEDSEQICGAVCNIRQKGSKISLWTTNAQNEDANRRIGQIMKTRLSNAPGPKGNLKICYENHSDVQNKQSSAIQSRMII